MAPQWKVPSTADPSHAHSDAILMVRDAPQIVRYIIIFGGRSVHSQLHKNTPLLTVNWWGSYFIPLFVGWSDESGQNKGLRVFNPGDARKSRGTPSWKRGYRERAAGLY